MATDTAVATASNDTTTVSAPAPTDPTRHVWQVPVLLLGIGAFVAVWQGWLSIGHSDPEAGFKRDIAALKSSYEKALPDPTDLKNQLNKVAGSVESYRNQEPLARFHLGSGYVRLAELTPNPDEARGYWILAHQHFGLVTDKQLRDQNDVPKLAFRQAKARAAVGLPADASLADLVLLVTVLSAPPPGEEVGETFRLIAELALRANPPDINRAKAALAQYLTATGIATPPASLARARLRLGDLHLQLKEYEQARKWLEQIGTDAPPDVLAPAKSELAQVLMAQDNFPAAAKEWELLRGAPNVPLVLRQVAAYQLGVCKLKLGDPSQAERLFEDVAKGTGSEATAAAVKLADLRLRSADPGQHKVAVDLLAASVKGVVNAGEYDPTLVSLNDVQAAFELAVTTLLADGAHESALKAAETYAAVCAPGRDRERRAEVLGTWAIDLQKKKLDSKPKFKAAADEYAALAAFQPKTDGKLDMLRRAATNYRQAGDPASAAVRLEEALKLPGIPEPTLGPLWLDLADSLLAANRPDEVIKILNKVMASSGDVATATRYRLARQFVDTRHPGLAPLGRAMFEQITKQQTVQPGEREFHERAFSDLAHILIHEGNFPDAEARARSQLAIYPNGPWAAHARLLLGVALLQRSAPATVAVADATKMRNEALANFKQIVADCDAIERRGSKLTSLEAWLRLQAAVRVLQTHQQMKNPRELLFEAAPLLDRHRGTVEELIILSLVYHAFRQLNDPGKSLDTKDRMKDVFDALPPSAFTEPNGEYSRDYWLKTWFPPEKKKE